MRMLAIGITAFVVTAALLVTAAPASAQIAGSMRGLSGSPSIRGDILRAPPADPGLVQRVSISREMGGIRDAIRGGRAAGQLSRSEARALRREGQRIEAMGARLAQGGYTAAEVAMLRSRTEALRSAVVAKRSQGVGGR
ncbi:hypothetical protein Q9Q95_19665 [Sphingomonas sp. DG1-23]|uniref:hypothetical protein n=1 Tax=Sphingomonas sp. DG1-23 TaxID=3068316 RepID=UPI00273F6310|nr:hypothetical protein [Sphingomonas sp. DG1-23]MDP5281152.1 hypothetical protein [Sphingomonas sp. DG1-23]